MIPTSITDQAIGLAPMEGTTDFPTRLWFQLAGAPASAGTPFVRVTDSYPVANDVDEKIWPELGFARERVRYRLIPQLMASSPTRFADVATKVLHKSPMVEFNCGCPAPRVVGGGAGSSLLQDPESFANVLRTISAGTEMSQLSVKIRTGFADDRDFDELVDVIGEHKLQRLVIHGRTRFQHYTGKADWTKIAAASTRLPYDVVGSGDVNDRSSMAERQQQAPQVAGVMIGRGALRNPWVFRELRHGAKVQLTRDELIYSLGAFALLTDAYRHDYDALKGVVEHGFFVDRHELAGEDAWRECYLSLSEQLRGAITAPTALGDGRPVIGRVKMMWNSMRSSLPPAAMTPHILRSKAVGELLTAVYHCLPSNFEMIYRPEHDWLFAGQKRDQ